MMDWMTDRLGLLGLVLVVALVVAIAFALVHLLRRSPPPSDDRFPPPGQSGNVP